MPAFRTLPCVPSGPLLLGLVLTVACDDPGPSPGSGEVPDAGPDTGLDGSGPEDTSPAPPTGPGAALIEAARAIGIDRYLGTMPAPVLESTEEATRTWAWGADDGPLCMRGDAFRYATRETGSDRLVVFLQGGGACWSEFCLAVTRAPAGIPRVDALNPDLAENPLAEWNIAYLPYCDGSLFGGDADVDEHGDGSPDRFHRGLQNLSAALQHARTVFPAPRQVLLTGSSAGGYGTLLATVLVRVAWPETELMVFNDSGLGLARPGDRAFIDGLLTEFNAADLVPQDCTECLRQGHITPLLAWTLERDPTLRIALFTSWHDTIIGDVFLQLPSRVFREAIEEQTAPLHAAYPDRLRRFIVRGTEHTALLGDPTGIVGEDLSAVELPPGFLSQLTSINIGGLARTRIGDVTVGAWLGAFVDAEASWVDLVEEPGDAPW